MRIKLPAESDTKGQVNFERTFWCLHFFQKNERKQVDLRYHTAKRILERIPPKIPKKFKKIPNNFSKIIACQNLIGQYFPNFKANFWFFWHLYGLVFYLETTRVSYFMIWWLAFELKPFQFFEGNLNSDRSFLLQL